MPAVTRGTRVPVSQVTWYSKELRHEAVVEEHAERIIEDSR